MLAGGNSPGGTGTEGVRGRAAQMVLAQNYDIAVFDRLLSTTYASL